MDKELKAKWVAALRSGEYRQAHGQLWDGTDGYCCIGVLCRLQGATDQLLRLNRMNVAPEELPNEGLSTYMRSNLATMNDGIIATGRQPVTFAQIADYIEANV